MTKDTTIAELVELAIEAEEAAEELYRGLARKFAHYEEVSSFWRNYAGAEAGHAAWLRRLWQTVNPRQLTAPLDLQVLRNAQDNLQRSIPQALQEIGNLEDAYQLAHELEHSEVNTVFEILVTNFADEETQAFLRAQLREHVAMLIHGFPAEFQVADVRRAIRALA